MEFKYDRVPDIRHISLAELPEGDNEWVVWAYCGIRKHDGTKPTTQPLVIVALRECVHDEVSDYSRLISVPVTHLGQLRIGSIWKAGIQVARFAFDEATFTVSYNCDHWRFGSFFRSKHENEIPPYPPQLYPLKWSDDRNEHLILKLGGGNRLVIPCLEYFSRMYGRSQDVSRVLATYKWPAYEGDDDDHLFCKRTIVPGEDGWIVKLRPRIRHSDAVFLAYVKYDSYARIAAKSVYADLEKQYGNKKEKIAFLQVTPWFTGKAKIAVQGIRFNNGKSFLALRIVGHSHPDPYGTVINIDRLDRAEVGVAESGDTDQDSNIGMSKQRKIGPGDELKLTNEEAPDHGAGTAEILDDDFLTIGPPRIVRVLRGEEQRGLKVAGKSSQALQEFSSDERRGSGTGTGYGSIHAKEVSEFGGTLSDMWKAALYLKKKNPGSISTVRFFTLKDGYSDSSEVMGTPFTASVSSAQSDGPSAANIFSHSWNYIDRKNNKRRGCLVIHLQCRNKSVHIVEIQRRKSVRIVGGKESFKEESFRGLVMVLEHDDLISEWLSTFIWEASFKKGIIGDLVDSVPGEAHAFNHNDSASDNVSCEGALINALKKVGVTGISR